MLPRAPGVTLRCFRKRPGARSLRIGRLEIAGGGGWVIGVVEDRGHDGLSAELVEVVARRAIDFLAMEDAADLVLDLGEGGRTGRAAGLDADDVIARRSLDDRAGLAQRQG